MKGICSGYKDKLQPQTHPLVKDFAAVEKELSDVVAKLRKLSESLEVAGGLRTRQVQAEAEALAWQSKAGLALSQQPAPVPAKLAVKSARAVKVSCWSKLFYSRKQVEENRKSRMRSMVSVASSGGCSM